MSQIYRLGNISRVVFFVVVAILPCSTFERRVLGAQLDDSLPTQLTKAIAEYPRLERPKSLRLEQLSSLPNVAQVKLSPNGTYVAYARREPNGNSVWLLNTITLQSRMLLKSRIIRSVEWSADSSTLIMPTTSGLAFADIETGKNGLFFRFEEELHDQFVGIDRSRPCHAWLSRTLKNAGGNTVYQLIRKGLGDDPEVVLESEARVYDFIVDDAGEIRFIRQAIGNQHVVYQLMEGEKQEVLRTSALDMCSLLNFHEAEKRVAIAAFGDTDLKGIHSLDLVTGTLRPIHQDPEKKFDLESTLIDGSNGKVVVASYYGDKTRNYALGKRLADDVAWLEASFDNSIELSLGSNSTWLVRERAAGIGHDRYYVFRRIEGGDEKLFPILQSERQQVWPISDSELSPMIPMKYVASDGLEISGYVSLPKGLPLNSVPLIASIHGGPFSRVRDRNSENQYFVNQGYAVFSPNFRSSSGFGLDFMKAGYGQFSTRVQLDILEGIDFLLANGIGDRDRVGAMGHSFGGYSVLSLLTSHPNRFAAGVATASPTDLLDTLYRIDQADINRYDGVPLIDVMPLLVADPNNSDLLDRMHRQSPAANFGNLKSPLLVWAGALDQRVPLAHVKEFAVEASELGKDVELFVDRKTGHNFQSQNSKGAKALLEITSAFFDEHLKGKRPALSEDSQDYWLRYFVPLSKSFRPPENSRRPN